jgi:hypothetical protein
MYRVVGVDTFDSPDADYLIGDFSSKKDALAAARREAGEMCPVYVYSDSGELMGSFGRP